MLGQRSRKQGARNLRDSPARDGVFPPVAPHGVVHRRGDAAAPGQALDRAPRIAHGLARLWAATGWPALLVLAVAALIYIGSAGTPALLDDTDSLYALVAREMNQRWDWITPYANGIRYLEKPPLFYWLISLSYLAFGVASEFTARLPTALAVVALVAVTYDIGRLLFGRAVAVVGALALATSAGLFVFTRIILPDAVLTLCLAVVFDGFVRWQRAPEESAAKTHALLAMYAFAALAVLAKGLIGVVFPAAAVLATLIATGQPRAIARIVSLPGVALFLAIAAPWHIAAGLQNPGFLWFYFVNEHVLRFLGQRLPMDYGAVPLVPFWLLHLVWLFPWSVYLAALAVPANFRRALAARRDAIVLLLAWAGSIVVFFSFSSRLEYYTLPAFPALALLAGYQAVACWTRAQSAPGWVLAALGLALGTLLIAAAGLDPAMLADRVLALRADPDLYVFYFGHLFDLTADSLAALRAPLLAAGAALAIVLPLHQLVRPRRAKAAVIASAMLLLFAAADGAFSIFAPHLTSKPFADEINRRIELPAVLVLDVEFEEASSLAFYTGQPLHLHDAGSVNLAYGIGYPDAPVVVLDHEALKRLWADTSRRVFIVAPAGRQARIAGYVGNPGYVIARQGGKVLLSNRSDDDVWPLRRPPEITVQ
jgi:4-amino-4-deoxy-L-arabinose transferase-like glycosyltransferase